MSYSRVAGHGAMVFDDHRNAVYARAIRQRVRPGSVVLDLGAGLGLHGLMAAAAGAARVYLVEPQPVVHEAIAAARAAGLADRIVVMQERIEEARLPEPVDAIVSVFTGNLLFSEDLLPALFLARDRWLKPGGALIPDVAELWLAPLQAPALHDKHVARWSRAVHGMDFSAARATAANEILWLRREELAGSERLCGGAAVASIDLARAGDAACDGQAACTVEAAGSCHGLLAWIRIRVGDEWLSSSPDAPPVHWSPVVLPLDPPLALQAGETLTMTLHRPAFGDWTWSATAPAGTRRHSTFLAASDAARELRRSAPGHAPSLSAEGELTLRILSLFAEGLTNGAVAERIAQEGLGPPARILREVQALARRYGKTSR